MVETVYRVGETIFTSRESAEEFEKYGNDNLYMFDYDGDRLPNDSDNLDNAIYIYIRNDNAMDFFAALCEQKNYNICNAYYGWNVWSEEDGEYKNWDTEDIVGLIKAYNTVNSK